MALVKISELTAAATLTGTEEYPITQNGTTKKASPDPPGTYPETTDFDNAASDVRTKLSNFYIGGKSDAFRLSASADGDQRVAINAFLADATLSGRRRLIGHAQVSDVLTVPAGVWLDAAKATIEQTGANTTAVTLNAGSRMVGGTIVGKTTDYVAGEGSFTPTAIGVRLSGSKAHVEDVEFIGVAQAAVFAQSAPDARVYGVRVTGVHGIGGIVIPPVDARNFGLFIEAGCTDIDIDDYRAENVSMGMVASYDTTGAIIRNVAIRNVPGQHGVYLQTGTGLSLRGVTGRDVHLELVKVQLSTLDALDSLGMSVSHVTGRTIGGAVLLCNVPVADLAVGKKFRGVNITHITGHDALRVLYLASVFGGEFSKISGYDTGADVVTILDCQDLDGEGIASRNSGKAVVRFSNAAAVSATGSATQRVTLRGVKGRNPGGTGVADDGYGVLVAGTGIGDTDGRSITVDGLDMSADNGFMRSAVSLTTANQETFRLRNARSRNHTVSPYALASATRRLGEWTNVDGNGANVGNFPTTLPVRIGSIGTRSRWSCAQLPTAGVFQQGDEIENTSPVAGGVPGWKVVGVGGAHGGSWVATTAYALGDWRRTSTGKVFEVTTAGTSGSVEPTATVIDSTVVDGTVTWTYRSATLATLKAMAAVAA